MADRTVGNGQTYATITAAIAAASAGDTVTVYDEDAFGGRMYSESLALNKAVTIRSEAAGKRYLIRSCDITAAGTLRDFIAVDRIIDSAGFGTVIGCSGGVTATIERGIVYAQDPGAFNYIIASGASTDLTVNNVLGVGDGIQCFGFTGHSSGTITCNYCAAVFSLIGFRNTGSATSVTCNNCVAFACGTDYSGTIGGTNNASTEASGVPGTNPVHNLTLAHMGFLRDEFPTDTTQYAEDYRSVEPAMVDASSPLVNGGAAVVGVTDDIDGRARHATTPNIGPCEDFLGPPGAATGVSATAGDARIEMAFTTPASADRVGFAVATSAASAATNANAGTFAKVIQGLAASTAYTGRSVTELSGGTNLANGTEYFVIVVPGNAAGYFYESSVAGDAVSATPDAVATPGVPSITAVYAQDGGFRVSLTGDAGVTHEIFFWTDGGTPTSGGTRSGDGDITVTNRTNGVILNIMAQSYNASNSYSRGTDIRTVMPVAAPEVPSTPISAYLDAMRTLYADSTNFRNWIQSVDASQTTSGRVILGWRPQTMPDLSEGPYVLLRWENFQAQHAGAANTFRTTVDIVADHVWRTGANPRSADEFITEMGYIDRILNEMTATIGTALDNLFGGHLVGMDAADSIHQDPQDDTVFHCEVRYTIGFGMEEE